MVRITVKILLLKVKLMVNGNEYFEKLVCFYNRANSIYSTEKYVAFIVKLN